MTERDGLELRGNYVARFAMCRAPRIPRQALRLTALLAVACCASALAATLRPIDAGWRFHLGDATDAQAPDFNDGAWRTVDLPHDWSIEGAPSPDAPSLGGGGFYPTGIGWYRLHFGAPASWAGRCVWVEFDGAYRDSEVWLNGTLLGRRPSGFASFRYDITRLIRAGGKNVLAVRVDNSAQPNSRYYTGSGLYRHVRLRIAAPLHVAPDGVVVSTQSLTQADATLVLKATIQNDGPGVAAAEVDTTIVDPSGRAVASAQEKRSLASHGSARVDFTLHVPHPLAWSPRTPALYHAIVRVLVAGRETDSTGVTFGVRTLRVSARRGLLLNGTPIKLYGGNMHDDNGLLGAAAFDRAEERRARLMKAAGFNAVRTAHNPPAPAFLDACDRLGLLVVEEAFDGWRKKKVAHDYSGDFDAWWRRDLDAMIRRDRNHPSVIMWSAGNEPYERASAAGAALAHQLADEARRMDPTRPVTAGINGVGANKHWRSLDPLFSAFDIAGYNYELARHTADRKRVPTRVIVSTESYQTAAFASWQAVHDDPGVVGDFVWSAMDYLGEAGIGQVYPPGQKPLPHWVGSHYPWHGAGCGDIDLTGFRRPLSHYRAIVWDRGERLYAAVEVPTPDGRPWQPTLWAAPPLRADWTWPGYEGRRLNLDVYSRFPFVRVYLNSDLIGEKPTGLAQQFKAVFSIPYTPGTLRIVGIQDGHEEETFVLQTSGPAADLRLECRRASLAADGQDLAFVHVAVTDAENRVIQAAAEPVTYTLTGPGSFAAIGNADLTAAGTTRDNPRAVYQGRALVVVRTQRGRPGRLVLTATAPGLRPASIELDSHP